MTYKAANGRLIPRSGNGRFRRATGQDIGVGGVCPTCQHLLLRHYDGDENVRPLDPAKWRYRCFTCEPREASSEQELDKVQTNEKENTA